MPLRIIEQHTSREASEQLTTGSTERRVYHVTGSDNVATMRAGLWQSGKVPAIIQHQSGRVVEFRGFERRRIGLAAWEWVASFADPDRNDTERKLEPGEWRVNYDTQGASVRMYQSLSTVGKYPAGVAPDNKGAINVKDGKTEGVDITIPSLKFSITFRHDATYVSPGTRMKRIRELAKTTGMVCDRKWLEHEIGELLFIGASGQFGNVEQPEVTYHFLGSDNAVGLSFGDVANVTKQGHDLLWIAYKEVVNNQVLVPQPEFVYVERVYRRGDLPKLLRLQGVL